MHPGPVPLLFLPSQDLCRVPWIGSWSKSVIKIKNLVIALCPMAQVGKGYVCPLASCLIVYGSLHKALVSMPVFQPSFVVSFSSFQSPRQLTPDHNIDHNSDPIVKRLDDVRHWIFSSQVQWSSPTIISFQCEAAEQCDHPNPYSGWSTLTFYTFHVQLRVDYFHTNTRSC